MRTRNQAADGAFVYAVRTTKIYCRPICSARLARRENVAFYPSSKDAESHGFRPCKRCKPGDRGTIPDSVAVQKLRLFLEGRSGQFDASTLDEMASQAGISKWHFHRLFKKHVGLTPAEYIRSSQGRCLTERRELADSQSTGASAEMSSIDGSESAVADYWSGIWSDVDMQELWQLPSWEVDDDWLPGFMPTPETVE